MSYMVNGKAYEYWSCTNQHILDKLIEREVLCCCTQEIEFILSRSWDDRDAPFTYDDVDNFYEKTCSNCEASGWIVETEQEDENGNPVYRCTECDQHFTQEEYDELDDAPAEVYEWWAVTGWFGDKLRAQGQCVIDGPCIDYWGRQCTGQAISLDGVVGRIAYEMGILEGQEYDWSKSA